MRFQTPCIVSNKHFSFANLTGVELLCAVILGLDQDIYNNVFIDSNVLHLYMIILHITLEF